MKTRRAVALSLCLIAGLSVASVAQVPTKISAFPSASTLTGSEYILGTQGGITVKLTASQVAALSIPSVFGRTGAIVAASNDYTFAQIGTKPTTIAGYGITDAVSSSLASAHLLVGNGSAIAASVALSGDATLANTGAITLATVNANVGSFGDATHCVSLTVNAKGLITAASQSTSCPGSGGGLTVGTTTIASGTNGNIEFNNAGVLGELATTGSGNVVRATSPTFVTPALGTPTSGIGTNLTGIPGTALIATRNAQTGTSYATVTGDGGAIVSLKNASAVAVSLSQANMAGFTNGFGTTYANIGAGLVTVTATTSLFGNGLTALKLATGQVADAYSDSTDYPITAVSLPKMAADTVLGGFFGTADYPVAATLTDCHGATNSMTYNTSTHLWGCNLTHAVTGAANVWTGQQSNSVTTLSISTATFTPDGTNNNYKLTLVHASCPCTLANPSATPVAGTSGVIEVIQSSTGSDAITTWGSQYLYAGGTSTIALSTGANAIDFISYYVIDPTHILLSTPVLNATH